MYNIYNMNRLHSRRRCKIYVSQSVTLLFHRHKLCTVSCRKKSNSAYGSIN